MQLVKDNRLLTFDEFKMLCRDMDNFRQGYIEGRMETLMETVDEIMSYLVENKIITPEYAPEFRKLVISQLPELK